MSIEKITSISETPVETASDVESETNLTIVLSEKTPKTVPEASDNIEDITEKILLCKSNIVHSFIEIGKLLNEAKEQLKQLGDELWLDWLRTRVDFTERTAERYMKLARECSNSTALSDLGMTKALALLGLPLEQRDDFINNTHEVYGVEKNVSEMTTREVEDAVREHKGSLGKASGKKPKSQFSFTPRNKKDRKKHSATESESRASLPSEHDIKTDIEYVQLCVDGLMEYLLEDDNEDEFYEYCSDLATLCESVLPYIPSDYGIQMCIERVTQYLEHYYCGDDFEDCKDELCELRDTILTNLPLSEATTP